MPALSQEEIRAQIADGSIVGITLDTSIFDRYGCNLKFPLLLSLDQFRDGSVDVVFSEVILSEVNRHIIDAASETFREVKKVIRSHKHRWKTGFDETALVDQMTASMEPPALAAAQIEQFINAVGANVLPATGKIDVAGDVIGRYFSGEAPFEKKDAKKSEFPDAFALLSLESVFASKRKMLLCVSADKGWAQFGEKSDWLVVVDQLDTALSYFNEAGRPLVDQAVALLMQGQATDLFEEIESSIQARIDDNDFVPETDGSLDFEPESESAALQSINLGTISGLKIVEYDEESVSFTFMIDATVNFEATFHFHAYDSIDKDYVHLSSEYASVERILPVRLIIKIQREMDPEPQVIETEAALKSYYTVDFGYVEPFPNEDPTHEKY